MTQDNKDMGGRRSFLKRSGIASAAVAGGLTGIPGAALACKHEVEGSYQEESPPMSWIYGDEFTDSGCDDNNSSGTKISVGSTAAYWKSYQWPTNEWAHYFSKTAYAEHYSENNSCEWDHDSGITQQWVGARSENSALGARMSSTPTHQGAYPASSGGEDVEYGNTVWTVATSAISVAFPATAPAMTAAAVLGALMNDVDEEENSTWDSYQHWLYDGEHSCVSHHARFLSEGYDDQPHLVIKSWFSNDIGAAAVENRLEITYPRTDDTEGSDLEANSTDEVIDRERPPKPQKGEHVEIPNGRSMEVESVRTRLQENTEMKVETPDEKEFQKRNPAIYAEKGVPSLAVEFPVRGETTVTTGRFVD